MKAAVSTLPDKLRIAMVIDALPFWGGAEKVLSAAWEVLPGAEIYTLVHNPHALRGTPFAGRTLHTSFIDRLPGARTHHRSFVPLYPLAVENFDLRPYDLILSFSYAAAHGVLTRPGQTHICLKFTPLRYAWQYQHAFLEQAGLKHGPRSWPVRILLHYLRQWDYAAAGRVDHMLAISHWIARCVYNAYRRPAEVLYPPVEVERFRAQPARGNFYLSLARLVPHKRVDLVVRAFSELGLPLLVIGEGRERRRLEEMAAPNIRFLGWTAQARLVSLLGQARALVHAAEEDFGIALVEAQAAGCPVIAYGQGGAAETVIPGRTGVLYPDQTVAGLVAAVRAFEAEKRPFDRADLQANAARFRKSVFQSELLMRIHKVLQDPQQPGHNGAHPSERTLSMTSRARRSRSSISSPGL